MPGPSSLFLVRWAPFLGSPALLERKKKVTPCLSDETP